MRAIGWLGLLLAIFGVILIAYGAVTLVERSNAKNTNDKSFVHYLAIVVGVIFFFLGLVMFLKGRGSGCKALSGEICIPVPANYAQEIENSLKSNRKAAFDKSFRPGQQEQGEVNPFLNQ